MNKLLTTLLVSSLAFTACAQDAPRAVDLGLSVKWADADVESADAIPEGWRLPTLAEIRELREGCMQSVVEKDGQEWVIFTGKNGNSTMFLYPIGSRSAREFGIAGSDGCYLKVILLNPLLSAPNRDGYYTWEELGDTSLGQRKYPVRLVKE